MATPKDLPQDIGGFIRDLRQAAKISLRQLAERAGVSNPDLSQIERGLRKPSAAPPPAATGVADDVAAGEADPQKLAALVEDVAVVEDGAAPPPPARNTT